MERPETPKVTFKVWDSTKDLLPYSTWLPEVVGTHRELIHIGSIPLSSAPPLAVRFKDADVSGYRRLLSLFRKRHSIPSSI